MKKKILNLLLIVFLVIGLTGCGNNDNSNTNNSSNDNNITENNTNNAIKEENVKEDNQELVDTLNNIVKELYEYDLENKKDSKYIFSYGLFNIDDKLQEKYPYKYEFLALCDEKFTEKIELTEFTISDESSENQAKLTNGNTGKCTYRTWEFTSGMLKKDGKENLNYYTLVKENDTNSYYNIKIFFKSITVEGKQRYYPKFSNSQLLN